MKHPFLFHAILFFVIFSCANTPPAVSQESDNGYEELVQINLELRQKLKTLEGKHTALENERNVLIVHIRNLQNEKDNLKETIEGMNKGPASESELKAAFAEVTKQLSLLVQERDDLKREFVKARTKQTGYEQTIQKLELERTSLLEELKKIEVTFRENQAEKTSVVTALETEKLGLTGQINQIQEAFQKQKQEMLEQNQKAMEEVKTRAGIEKEEAVETLKKENTALADQMEELQMTFEKEKAEMSAQSQMDVESVKAANEAAVNMLKGEKEELTAGLRQLKKASEHQKKGFLIEKKKAVETVRIEGQTAMKALEKECKKLTAEKKGLAKQQDKLTAAMGQAQENFRKERLALEKKLKAADEKGRQMEKDLAMEVALYRTKEEELKSHYQILLLEHEDFKREIPQLKEESKDLSEKLKKSDEEKNAAREELKQWEETWHGKEFAFKKEEGHWRRQRREISGGKEKLEKELQQTQKEGALNEKKLQDMKVILQQTEDKMAALQKQSEAERLAQKKQEALIKKLMGEKSVLEVKLAKQPRGQMSPAGSRLIRRGKSITGVDRQRLDMHFNLAVAYDKTGMYREEENEYLQCLKIDPNDANVHYNLAILYDDRLNDNLKAIKYYKRYLQLRPSGEDTEQVKDWLLYAQEEAKLK